VKPLYSSDTVTVRPVTDSKSPGLAAELASVSIEPAGDVLSQRVRNRLIFLFGRGAGEPASPAYRLQLNLSTASLASASESIGDKTDHTGRPTAGVAKATSNFVLFDRDGKAVTAGTRSVSASFDRPRREFATLRANRGALERAGDELAEQIFLAIAQKLLQRSR
jgi:LPS-assembly lipoprotein